ncbi:hypothetical protein [Plantactinospora sp. BC1]|nr:hypothetical protein [Plantactinospora sp. BC1]
MLAVPAYHVVPWDFLATPCGGPNACAFGPTADPAWRTRFFSHS